MKVPESSSYVVAMSSTTFAPSCIIYDKKISPAIYSITQFYMTKRDYRSELCECGTAVSISYLGTDNVQIQEEIPMLNIPKPEDIMQPY